MSTRRASAARSPAVYLLPSLCLLIVAGCENFRGFEGDPLTGGPPIPRGPVNNPNTQNNRAAPVVGLSATAPQSPLPPLSAPASSTSPAALTGGGVNPVLDPARDLRIGAGLGNPNPQPIPYSDPGAVLRQPLPVNDGSQTVAPAFANPSIAVSSAGIALTSAGRIDTYQQLQDALASRGVTWQRLETLGDNGEWKFSCSIPNRSNPNLRKTYEARGRTDLGAVRTAIDQIDREQQGTGR